MKLVTIVGARPQFIKAAAFSNKFRGNKNNIEILVHTGQHYDKNMSDVFFEELGIPVPDYNLEVGSGSHGQQTGRMLEKIEEILLKENPDGVLLYGDTNSTLAGALAASKLLIPVFHVEAGLRSYDMKMPEEQNRVLTDHLSSLLFCPTQTAVNNLKTENIVEGVYNVGDIMLDSVIANLKIAEKKYCDNSWINELNLNDFNEKRLDSGFYLATIHRPINTDNHDNLKTIIMALNELNRVVLMPLHPRTKKQLDVLKLNTNNIIFVDPVGYLLMLYLIKKSHMVITDSGGLQKEAYFLTKNITTLRDETEWVETLKDEWNVLVKIEQNAIIKNVMRKPQNKKQEVFFGEGNAAFNILNIIADYLSNKDNNEKT